jgi:hypothetical protein
MQTSFDIVTPLRNLKATADSIPFPSVYTQGYRDGLTHAIELAQVMQIRLNVRLAAEQGAS